jgi:hypothetical protein
MSNGNMNINQLSGILPSDKAGINMNIVNASGIAGITRWQKG